MNEQQPSLKEKLLTEIRSGSVAMTPRVYFTLKFAAVVLVSTAIVLVTIFVVTFIFFSIRISGNEALLGFGTRGFETFLFFFPWHLLVLDIALILFLQWLLRTFRFGYTIPVLYLIGGLLCGAALVGFVLDRGTPLNDALHEAREYLPPPLGDFYEGAHKPLPRGSGICRCEILNIEGNTLTLLDVRDGTSTLTVVLPFDNPRATTTGLQVGDVVFVAGDEDDDVIRAFGVRVGGRHLPSRDVWQHSETETEIGVQ